ncbi:tRNA modification GTPase [Pseudochelatococcus lubricantis]|uniref:tRNA modification GTPase MnmE n=1 Tax=Pseudochelatococcus lubricantis TaxID=1538102 RepID=A0ABX0V234_9HYPH|nr:tRNA modification GTPase [Pseudochelatococcus lubricantis]
MRREDTIVAVATGSGRAAIAVLRLSGPATRRILEVLAGSVPQPRFASLRAIYASDGAVLDRALVIFFSAPASFTGEDVAELHLHGGPAVIAAVLGRLLETRLCRLAEAGEFSRRAFINGKLDLTEAEGIADLIDAETETQRRQAMRQLEGALSLTVENWRERLVDTMALVEASLDFSDEGDVPEGLTDEAVSAASLVGKEIETVLNDGARGERLRDGFTVVIAGPPNVGKSTLINRIAGRDVAIVSPVAGTTRDMIELHCDLGGTPVVFVDTAGLRDTDDPVEREGVVRARKRAQAADLVLLLFDNKIDADTDGATGFEAVAPENIIMVRTKYDLQPDDEVIEGAVAVSAKTGTGIDILLKRIEQQLAGRSDSQTALITRERHRTALTDAARHLSRVSAAHVSTSPELLAEDIRLGMRALGRITGRVDVEDVLDRLFAGFCIGK